MPSSQFQFQGSLKSKIDSLHHIFNFFCNLFLNLQGPSPQELVQACLGPRTKGDVSGAKFLSAIRDINMQNGLIDLDFVSRWSRKTIKKEQICTVIIACFHNMARFILCIWPMTYERCVQVELVYCSMTHCNIRARQRIKSAKSSQSHSGSKLAALHQSR